jgi:DNA repair protein RadC
MSIKLTAKQKAKPIYTAADIYAIIQPILLRENRMRRKLEYFWVLGIDSERHLKFAELLALGGQNRVHIKPADAFRMAIYKETDYVIFIHNHPTGKLNPSPEDKDATDRLIKAAEVVDIKVADHFIISETKYFSFVEAGLMKQLRESKTYTVLHEDEMELLKLQMQAAGMEEKAIAMAISLLKDNLPIEFIVKHTGLKKKVVEGLLKK